MKTKEYQIANLKEGQKVTFSKVPSWSYLKAGETYVIESMGEGDIHFRNPETKGASFEKIRDLSFFEIQENN
jgi:hypothetical protein